MQRGRNFFARRHRATSGRLVKLVSIYGFVCSNSSSDFCSVLLSQEQCLLDNHLSLQFTLFPFVAKYPEKFLTDNIPAQTCAFTNSTKQTNYQTLSGKQNTLTKFKQTLHSKPIALNTSIIKMSQF